MDMNATSQLMDGHGRLVEYLRLSVTGRCNLRCRYCLPDGSPPESPDLLSLDEMAHIASQFIDLGIKRIRLTGGEPLVRRNLPDLVNALAKLPGLEDISLTTNGILLSTQAAALKDAGLNRINVSLDSLDHSRIQQITGANVLKKVLTGLDIANAVGLKPIKINMVVMKDINEDEVETMAMYCADRGYILRLIEPMPMGNIYTTPAAMTPIIERLTQRFDLTETDLDGGGPARYLMSNNRKHRIGLITPLSQHFCSTCNRVRLSANGTLYTCLDEENGTNLGTLLRQGADNSLLCQAITEAIMRKQAGHNFTEQPIRQRRLMSLTGG